MQMVWKISWNSPGHAAPGRRNSRNGEGLAEPLSWSPGGDQPWDPPPHPRAQGIPPSPGNALGMPWDGGALLLGWFSLPIHGFHSPGMLTGSGSARHHIPIPNPAWKSLGQRSRQGEGGSIWDGAG